MALNWAMLSPNGELLPLQDEKTFLRVASVDCTIKATKEPSTPVRKAHGSIYITSKRIVFVSATAKPHDSTAAGNPPSVELETLSCPLSHLLDGRFVQPWLAANYYEADIKPVRDGGLKGLQLMKIDFKEGRGFEFTTAVEEVKTRHDNDRGQRQAEAETLPIYSPPIAAAGLPDASVAGHSSQRDPSSYFPARQTSTHSMPDDGDLQAASVARDEEAREVETAEEGGGLPPAYDAR